MLIRGREPSTSKISAITTRARKLRDHIPDEFGTWKPSHVEPHGKVSLQMSVCHFASQQLKTPKIINTKAINIHALVDTGAQMCVADIELANKMGLRKQHMMTPALTVSVADNADLELVSAVFIKLTAPGGLQTHQLVYFASGVGEFYLSKPASIDLQIVPSDFPKVGSVPRKRSSSAPPSKLS